MSIEKTPWDTAVFGVPTFEIRSPDPESLDRALKNPGHYTLKVDPLSDKKILHEAGCYYCDTLIEPYCDRARFRKFEQAGIIAEPCSDLDALHSICHGAFSHGRFHRDFNLEPASADRRYDNWMRSLTESGKTLGLFEGGVLAGFICHDAGFLLLHALAENFRGRGKAKYFWSAACSRLFEEGEREIKSSISASNLSVLNLYAGLGFKFGRAVDIYHLYVK